MKSCNQVGLILRRPEEREMVCAAALKCGLEPVILDRRVMRGDVPLAAGLGAPASPGGRIALIVTDVVAGEESAEEGPEPAPMQVKGRQTFQFSAGFSPLRMLVSDTDRELAGFAWVMQRPLQRDAVRVQLRQAARTARAVAAQYEEVSEELRCARRAFNSVANGIIICDATSPDLPLIYINPAFERITGYSFDEAFGRNCRFLQGSDTDQPGLGDVRKAILEHREVRVLLRNFRKDGTPFWNELYLSPMFDDGGRLTHFIGIQNDVTAQVDAQQSLDHLAHHDSLTGLANRSMLHEELRKALRRAERRGSSVAVVFLDLDNFKQVNDIFGHEEGDKLLKVVAGRLQAATRAGETVARLGGDEFVVVLEEVADAVHAMEAMERLRVRVKQMTLVFGQHFQPSVSAGLSMYPEDGTTAEELLRVADFRMYSDKHETRRLLQEGEESNSEAES